MSHSNARHVVPVNELNFEEEVTRSALPVLIDVSAAWCAPCKVARPVVAALAAQHQGALKVVEIDIEAPILFTSVGILLLLAHILRLPGAPAQTTPPSDTPQTPPGDPHL